jgi:hypothetical protein
MTEAPNRIERLVGRSLAACAHPYAAWRHGSVPVRLWLVTAYFAGSYLTVIGALRLLLS